jgi:hypothetical protein
MTATFRGMSRNAWPPPANNSRAVGARANVSVIQTTVDELRDEMKLVRDAGR